jgi:hypothetical protein
MTNFLKSVVVSARGANVVVVVGAVVVVVTTGGRVVVVPPLGGTVLNGAIVVEGVGRTV